MPRLRFSRLETLEKTEREPVHVEERERESETSSRTAPQPRIQAPPTVSDYATTSRDDRELIERVQSALVSEPESPSARRDPDYFPRKIASLVNEQIDTLGRVVSDRERARLIRFAQAELLGLGPLEPLLADESVTEIMVNGPDQIWVERSGRLQKTSTRFLNDEHVRRIIDRIISPLGRRCDEMTPMVDARLSDGSRLNAIIPPLALNGPTLTIRKFFKKPLGPQDLVSRGAATAEMMELLRACVLGRLNMIVSGGTGTGKTTLLNCLSSFIPGDERIITIENAAELQLQQEHVVSLETRPANIEGRGEVSIRDLVVNSLRMRPDRVVIGECRSGEALDMLQAMNTGHDGSMTTLHANTPRDTIHRLETLVLMAGMDLPQRAIREQIASAVNVIVQLERMQDGSRKVVKITEVTGMEGDVISLSDIFVFQQQGIREGKVVGRLVPTGLRPRFMERLQAYGINLPPNIFGYTPGARGDRL